MASTIKIAVFKGVENEDPYQFWFMVKVVWEAQGVTDDNMKKETLLSALQDRALTWYIKISNKNLNARIADIQTMLDNEISRPKLEAQSIIRFKEITMLPGKTLWDLDQRLKCTIHEANMTLIDGQHHEYFVASLT